MKPHKTLHIVLALSVALSPLAVQTGTLFGLQTSVAAPTPAKTSQSHEKSDVTRLLILAMREENPSKALELLARARVELQKENISSENAEKILAAVDALETKIRAKISRLAPASGTASDPALYAAAATAVAAPLGAVAALPQAQPVTPEISEEQIKSTLESNPELREALWQIGQGRFTRDAQNLDGIIKEKTGKSIVEIDHEEILKMTMGNQPGPFLELLQKLNLMNADVSKTNIQLMQEFDGVSIDELAEKLVKDATKYSLPVGALQGVLAESGFGGRYVGISTEVLATFVINANLALQIADLYGIKMNNSEKEVVLLVVFAIVKVAGQLGTRNGNLKSLVSRFGESLGRLKATANPAALVAFMKQFLANRAIARAVGPETAAIANIGSENDKAGVDGKDGKLTTKQTVLKTIASKINFMSIFRAAVHGARSAGETYLTGQAAIWLFKSAHLETRTIHNQNFRHFLMTPAGEGFIKLLVHSMRDGENSALQSNPTLLPFKNHMKEVSDARTMSEFVLNLARSMKACSSMDIERRASDPQSQFACKDNPNTDRYERIVKEMLTFNEIPNEFLAELRIAPREHRYRMAELVVQMQFLDGDRSPSEVLFFRNTVAKTLGLETLEDSKYFDRLHAFVIERGGLESTSTTPTGFAIRGTSASLIPYDMARGYSPNDAPVRSSSVQAPAAPAGQPVAH